MNIDQFWQVIDEVHAESCGDMDRKCELLKQQLNMLGDDELRDFLNHFDALNAAAYTWALWGAVYVMRGGCSDDSFSDFRATLISHGRAIYERALENPETLCDLHFRGEEDICYEGFQYVKNEVAKDKLGELPKSSISFPDEPSGSEWDEDSLDELFPKLSAKYADVDEVGDRPSLSKPWWKFW